TFLFRSVSCGWRRSPRLFDLRTYVMRASGCSSLILSAASSASSASIVSASVLVGSFKPTVYVVIGILGDPGSRSHKSATQEPSALAMSFVPYRQHRHAEQQNRPSTDAYLGSHGENIGYRPMFQNHETAPLMTSIAELLTQKQNLL